MKSYLLEIQQTFLFLVDTEKNKAFIENALQISQEFAAAISQLKPEDISEVEDFISVYSDKAKEIKSSMIMTFVSNLEIKLQELVKLRGNVVETPIESMLSKVSNLNKVQEQLSSAKKNVDRTQRKISERKDEVEYIASEIKDITSLLSIKTLPSLSVKIQEMIDHAKNDCLGGEEEHLQNKLDDIEESISQVYSEIEDIYESLEELKNEADLQSFSLLDDLEKNIGRLDSIRHVVKEKEQKIEKELEAFNTEGVIFGSIKEHKLTTEELKELYDYLENKHVYKVFRFKETKSKNKKKTKNKVELLSNDLIFQENGENNFGIFIIGMNEKTKLNTRSFVERAFSTNDRIKKLILKSCHVQSNYKLTISNPKVLYAYEEIFKKHNEK